MKKTEGCPLCGLTSTLDLDWTDKTKTINRVKCARCGLIFFNTKTYPKPTYDQQYNRHFFRPGDIKKAGIIAAQIAEIIKKYQGTAKILEIGAGNGLTAYLLTKQNYSVDIVEPDWLYSYWLIQHYKLQVYPCAMENSDFTEHYDFIYAGHVIEHAENPKLFLEKVHKSLTNNGLFFYDTPNTHYARQHGSNWKHYNTRDEFEHCSLFSLQTAEYAAHITNFEILEKESLPEFQSMQILMRKK